MCANKKAKPLIKNDWSLCFMASKVDISNFYKDLERVIEFREFVKYSSKNCDHSLPSKTNQKVK
jgi:hypothetical protein